MWVGMVRGGHSSGGPADLETLRKETRLEIQLKKLPGGVWLKAHWEVRLAAVHVEAQREEARYTVLGALSRSPAAPTTSWASIDPKIDRKHRAFSWNGFCVGVWPKTPGKSRVAFQTPFFSFFK